MKLEKKMFLSAYGQVQEGPGASSQLSSPRGIVWTATDSPRKDV